MAKAEIITCYFCKKTKNRFRKRICWTCYHKGNHKIPLDALPKEKFARCHFCKEKNIVCGYLWTRRVCSICWVKRNQLRLKFVKDIWRKK